MFKLWKLILTNKLSVCQLQSCVFLHDSYFPFPCYFVETLSSRYHFYVDCLFDIFPQPDFHKITCASHCYKKLANMYWILKSTMIWEKFRTTLFVHKKKISTVFSVIVLLLNFLEAQKLAWEHQEKRCNILPFRNMSKTVDDVLWIFLLMLHLFLFQSPFLHRLCCSSWNWDREGHWSFGEDKHMHTK